MLLVQLCKLEGSEATTAQHAKGVAVVVQTQYLQRMDLSKYIFVESANGRNVQVTKVSVGR